MLENRSFDRSGDVPNYLDWMSAAPISEIRKLCSDLDFTQYAFSQPDGSPIGIRYPGRGRQPIYFFANSRFYNFKPFANKHRDHSKCTARLELLTQQWKKQFVVCVDIDHLPQSVFRRARILGSEMVQYMNPHEIIKKGCESLSMELQNRMGNNGAVFLSVRNGYPKIIICIEYNEPVKEPSKTDIIALFSKLLPEYMAESCIDFSRSGLYTTYIPWDQRDILAEQIRNLTPIKIEKTFDTITFKAEAETFTAPSTFTYIRAKEIPEALRKKRHRKSYREFLECLCAMPHLVREGFAISQKVLARTLGISQKLASIYLRRAQREGLIEIVDDRYIPDKRAKIYKAKGVLAAHLRKKIKSKAKVKPPTKIQDGQWHQTYIQVARCFKHAPGRFMSWVKSVPGHDKKDRLEQARGVHKWLKKISTSTEIRN